MMAAIVIVQTAHATALTITVSFLDKYPIWRKFYLNFVIPLQIRNAMETTRSGAVWILGFLVPIRAMIASRTCRHVIIHGSLRAFHLEFCVLAWLAFAKMVLAAIQIQINASTWTNVRAKIFFGSFWPHTYHFQIYYWMIVSYFSYIHRPHQH